MDSHQLSFFKILGKGGFGTVYLAEIQYSNHFRKQIAIKILHRQFQSTSKNHKRHHQEALVLGLLNHPNILKVFEIRMIRGRMAFLMEFITGMSLKSILDHHIALSPKMALEIMIDCSSALDFAWKMPHPKTQLPLRVIHRDIKPSNIWLSSAGTIKLFDFGIAKIDSESMGSSGNEMVGTLKYMAPEQWLFNSVSSKVDVFALGITILELLQGAYLPKLPLNQFQHQQDIETFLSQISFDGCRELKDLLQKMLAYEPENRLSIQQVHQESLLLLEKQKGQGLRSLVEDSRFKTEFSNMKHSQNGYNSDSIEGINAEEPSMIEEETMSLLQEFTEGSLPNHGSTTSPSQSNRPNIAPDQSVILQWPFIRNSASLMILWGMILLEMQLLWSVWSFHPKPLMGLIWNPQQIQIHLSPNAIVINDLKLPLLLSDAPIPKVVQSTSTHSVIHKPMPRDELPHFPITISSKPLGAEIYVDGAFVGHTLLHQEGLSQGKHLVLLKWQEKQIEKMVHINQAQRFSWQIERGQWLVLD